MTLVSIGLPVYNGEKYLSEALSSAVAQTHQPLEIVVSDNGSTDATEEICREFAATYEQVRYHRHEVNRGAAFNHNYVVHQAKGEYFRWYSYDDRLDPACISACVGALDADPGAVLAWPQTYVIDETGEVTSEYRNDLAAPEGPASVRLSSLLGRPTHESLLHMCYPIYGLMRTEVLRSTRLLQNINAGDDVLLVELALRGRWVHVPERLFYNRRHAESSVPGRTPEQIAAWFDPARGTAFPMPQSALLRGYLRAIAEASLPTEERLRCLRVVAGWVAAERRWRVIGGEVRIRGEQRVRRLL
ncbi:glycosyltransferase family 2 protein [Terrabacter aerolatus]|uniref:Glycosyl transferase n=1 Tax=Terrabacter aerolatus TaxID=422442 RepID=A0A512D3Q1_9MICO|nr:glycosyltransferase family A protein [Terrabacter aerolatus]GEO31083.1 glycosyl transferase [Terrabacter aerolatus]